MAVFLPILSTTSSALPDPHILTIEQKAGLALRTYDADQLRHVFPLQERTTATPWSDGQTRSYRGPLLKDILARSDIAGARTFEISAFNGFISIITGEEIDAYSPIVAIEQECDEEDRTNGPCKASQTYRPLTVEDGGPFYLIWRLKDLPSTYVFGRKSIWVWFVVAVRPSP